MPLPPDLLVPDLDRPYGLDRVPIHGARWACGLAATLLALLALTVALRSLPSDGPGQAEKIVQQPMTPDASAAAAIKASEVTAPDPGDNLP